MLAPSSHFPIPRAHAAHRSWPSIVGAFSLFSLFPALMMVPRVTQLLALERTVAVVVGLAWVVLFLAASVAFRLTGFSRLYSALDLAESFGIQLGLCVLIYCSGSAVSLFWIAYLAHVQMVASVGLSARNAAVIAFGPPLVALGFWLNGDGGSAWLSVLVGVLGTHMYQTTARVYLVLEQTVARESQLKEKLARLRVDEERTRISRDLHDGVAGELAALAWRLRRVAVAEGGAEPTAESLQKEMQHLGERVGGALASLRGVVLDLRPEQRGWAEMLAVLREICHDLCGNGALLFEADERQAPELSQRAIDEVRCIVVELVKNAATHARPGRVEVSIRVEEGVVVSVSDDGSGFPSEHSHRSSGGIANIRLRVARLGGRLMIHQLNPGTRITVSLPGPPAY